MLKNIPGLTIVSKSWITVLDFLLDLLVQCRMICFVDAFVLLCFEKETMSDGTCRTSVDEII